MYPNIHFSNSTVIYHFLQPLIFKLAETHPDWKFIEHRRVLDSENNAAAAGFIIRFAATDEELGQVSLGRRRMRDGSRTREDIFDIYNTRIQQGRERGHSYMTNKLKDAIKAVNKSFFPKTLDELIDEAYDKADFYVRQHAIDAERKYTHAMNGLHVHLFNYAKQDWEGFTASIPSGDTQVIAMANNVDELRGDHSQAQSMWHELNNKTMLTVHFVDGKYIVGQGSDRTVYESDTLPMDIRQQVGMLKLVPEQEVIPDVGLRIGNTYIIMQPNQGA